MPQTTSDSEGPTKEEFTFLVIFFGVTPFSILGIHDFFIGRKLQGLLHLVALMVAVLAQTLPLTIGLVADVSKANNKIAHFSITPSSGLCIISQESS